MALLPFAGKPFKFKSVPSGPTEAGNYGDLATDGDYLYVCIAANTWERTALATWTPPVGGPGSPMGLLLALTYPA